MEIVDFSRDFLDETGTDVFACLVLAREEMFRDRMSASRVKMTEGDFRVFPTRWDGGMASRRREKLERWKGDLAVGFA